MKVTAPMRGQRPTKRADMTDIKHLFQDTRLWCSIGIVQSPDGESHYEITDSDVLVEVVLQPSLTPITARLSAGMMRIPNVGDEVLVQIPDGRIDFLPTIVDRFATKVATTQGPALNRALVVEHEVIVHDGAGGAAALPTLSSLTALVDAITNWNPVPSDGGAALKVALLALFGGTGAYAGAGTWPYPTTVLKAK